MKARIARQNRDSRIGVAPSCATRIVFRSGPAGRRPGLQGGPDLWEVVAVHRSFGAVVQTAGWLDQPVSAIDTALRYYETHKDEIDEWIRRNEEAAAAAERVWRARQAAL